MTRLIAGFSLCLISLAWPAAAQIEPATPAADVPAPAHVAVIDGVAWLDRQGRSEPAPANMPLVAGDRLRTDRGRVEVLFGDGSALDIDYYTTVDFQSDALIRLLAGRVRLVVTGLDPNNPDERVDYRIDTPSGAVEILTVGDYRVSLIGTPVATDTELAVLRGSANLVTDAASVPVAAGARSVARAGAPPSYPTAFNSARWDAFDRWTEDQQAARLGVASNAYLPAPLSPYASTFDRYGQWRQDPSYGHVWYPTVAPDWEPYWYGNWSYVGPYGWTWIGADPWAWPTHHFGRWGFSAGLWFWIPGVHWGPAWVSWAWAPGYVGWCPLGYYGSPVFGVNVFYSSGYRWRAGRYPWHGWHVARADAFAGGHVSPRRHGVPIDRIDERTRAGFASRTDAPTPRGVAMTRAAVPIRVPGERTRYAVPRNPDTGPGLARPIAPAAPSPDGRTAGRSRAPLAPGLGAPPRYGPTASSPGLGTIAPSARGRAAVRTDRPAAPPTLGGPRRVPSQTAPRATVPSQTAPRLTSPSFDRAVPRRVPQAGSPAPMIREAPSYARPRPAVPRGYDAPSSPARRYELPSAPMRQPGPPREDAPAYRRGGGSPSVRSPEPGPGPSPRARPSGPSGGGAVQRSAPPRSPGGSRTGPASSAPRGGQGGNAARRRPG